MVIRQLVAFDVRISILYGSAGSFEVWLEMLFKTIQIVVLSAWLNQS